MRLVLTLTEGPRTFLEGETTGDGGGPQLEEERQTVVTETVAG